LGSLTYPYTSSSNPLKFYIGTGIQTYNFLLPSFDSVSCTLEPDPYFNNALGNSAINCNNTLDYFDSAAKTWNCPWDVNSKSNWLTTDGTKIVIDTSMAAASTTVYYV
jgi:hypothetical protein